MTTDTAVAIDELGRRWTDAELHADTDALETLLDDQFIAVGPLGFMLTRSDWLDRHRRGDLAYEALTWEPGPTRTYGDVALTIGTQTAQTTYRGNRVPFGRLRITQIAVRHGDRWLLAGLHMSQTPDQEVPR
jgi:hypothetical protein